MRSSYKKEDVILLLKDITGLVKPQGTKERESLIQSGHHYCEMLPIEYVPTSQYMEIYKQALKDFAKPTAHAIGALADKIMKKRGRNVVLVSLARAGIPVGILLKHYLSRKYEIDVPHYAISIIRGRGIDNNAMNYLLERYQPEHLLFVDGWIGKGAISNQLKEAVRAYPKVSSDLAVAADPAYVTELYGTREDILIPSSCLNSTVSGLISRTFLRSDIIGEKDFHGAVYYEKLNKADLSYHFIEAIEREFEWETNEETIKENLDIGAYRAAEKGMQQVLQCCGIEEVKRIAKEYGISDIHLIKPGIGETTRVLLRRVPWKILINQKSRENYELAPIIRLAQEKEVPVEYYPLKNYKACGLIKKLADT